MECFDDVLAERFGKDFKPKRGLVLQNPRRVCRAQRPGKRR